MIALLTETMPTISITDALSTIRSILIWVLTVISEQPILLVFFAVPLVYVGIRLVKRLKGV